MPPSIRFDHSTTYVNTGLSPAGTFKVGQSTSIGVTLQNDGDEDGVVDVRLWWGGPTAGAPAGTYMNLLTRLDPPDTSIIYTIPAASGGTAGESTKTVSWAPSAADFPVSLGGSIHGCLFAQTLVQPIAPAYPGDGSALDNWDPTYGLCAQHNIDIITTAPSRKTIHYAFGVGHGLNETVDAQITVENVAIEDPALLARMNAVTAGLGIAPNHRSIPSSDAKVALGAERVWTPGGTCCPPFRLGYMGLLDTASAKKLLVGKYAKTRKIELNPGELRQCLVEIMPPKGLVSGDSFAVGIINEVAGTSADQRRILGTLTLVVQVV